MTLVVLIRIILLLLLIICAVAVNLNRNLLQAVIIFMAYSLIMCVIWILMESPDLTITEAAVGAGISGTLFLMTLKKINVEDAGEILDEKTGMLETGASEKRKQILFMRAPQRKSREATGHETERMERQVFQMARRRI